MLESSRAPLVRAETPRKNSSCSSSKACARARSKRKTYYVRIHGHGKQNHDSTREARTGPSCYLSTSPVQSDASRDGDDGAGAAPIGVGGKQQRLYRLHGFASRNDTTRAVLVFLLNKCNGTAEKVRLVLPKPAASSITVVTLADTAAADVQGSERWGTVQQPRQLVCVTGVCEFKLPPLSFSVVAA